MNNTAQTLWNTLLQSQTPFDINLQLTSSLTKGQLAEAVVTKYDSEGRPIGGTIEVDPIAHGLAWFIDPTITDPTEFSQTLSTTASRATANSDAYGHYDLLTAILHEMAHLAGFISGNSGFDLTFHVKCL
ncbi:MAG: hypothetical protein H0X31_22290 [Nostocaceae cyanobacterium]|nr:hypothetical protein [Nostocaceae cyanobacterium]